MHSEHITQQSGYIMLLLELFLRQAGRVVELPSMADGMPCAFSYVRSLQLQHTPH